MAAVFPGYGHTVLSGRVNARHPRRVILRACAIGAPLRKKVLLRTFARLACVRMHAQKRLMRAATYGLKMKRINAGTLLAMSCVLGQTATGHHSQAAFDQTKEILLEGQLVQFALNNPHTYLTLQIAGADDTPVSQDVEAGPISTVQPLGLTRDSLRIGERVVVRAYPSRRGAGHTAYGLDVTRADGKVFPLSVSAPSVLPASTERASSITGVWHPTFAGFASLYGAIASWPLTDEGRRRLTDARREGRTTQSDCIPAGAPMLMVYPVAITVEVRPSEVLFDIDWMGSRRVVQLDADHPQNLSADLARPLRRALERRRARRRYSRFHGAPGRHRLRDAIERA